MYTPTRSSSGSHLVRIVGSSALLLSISTGALMAANPGCQAAFGWEAVRAHTVAAHKVHHTAATLARWKVGAAAWSKAHHGKVYAGHQPVQVEMVWKPLTYRCGDIALVTGFAAPVLTGEAPPEFNAYAVAIPSGAPVLDIALAENAPLEGDEFLSPIYGGPVGGTGRSNGAGPLGASGSGPVGSSSVPPIELEPARGRTRLLPPQHRPQEVALLPAPLPPPAVVPTPEPSTMVLLGTGLATLGLGRARKRAI